MNDKILNSNFDIIIIGGGINGTGIAHDASGRGLSVLLCEQNDLASGTSSASSQLIHGGLRYLEHYAFSLVRHALKERDILRASAPHLITPLKFILPYHAASRPKWLLRFGLWIYDHLGGKSTLPKSKAIDLTIKEYSQCLKCQYTQGFSYYDCHVDDARLVIHNALAAAQNGAVILTGHQLTQATRHTHHWEVTLTKANGSHCTYQTKVLINASGSWVDSVLHTLDCKSQVSTRLIKGSHIIVPRLYAGEHAYILQNHDNRVIFIIPYLQHYSLIGTTDLDYSGDLKNVIISAAEVAYLCQCVNHYFKVQLQPTDIITHYSGVRPLYGKPSDEAKTVTRDFYLELNASPTDAPLLSIFGGKITTYRILSEQVLTQLQPFLPHAGPAWTAQSILPGGDITHGNMEAFIADMQNQYSWLEKTLLTRYCHTYGTRIQFLLANCYQVNDLGHHYGAGLYQQEIDYLIKHEWARACEDIIWRRTKLGMFLSTSQIAALQAKLANHIQ